MLKLFLILAALVSFPVSIYAVTVIVPDHSAHCVDASGWKMHIKDQPWELTEKAKNYGWRVRLSHVKPNKSMLKQSDGSTAYDSLPSAGDLRVEIVQTFGWGGGIKNEQVFCRYYGPVTGKLGQELYITAVNVMQDIKHSNPKDIYEPSPAFPAHEPAFTRFEHSIYKCNTIAYVDRAKNCFWEWNSETANDLPAPTVADSDVAHCPVYNIDFKRNKEANKWELSKDAVNRGWRVYNVNEKNYQDSPSYTMNVSVGFNVDCTVTLESSTTPIVVFRNVMHDVEKNLSQKGCSYPAADQTGQCTWQWKGSVN